MTVKDVYQKLAQRQLEGVMFHEAMASYFTAICAAGFAPKQAKQATEEFKNYLLTKQQYELHYGPVLQDMPNAAQPNIIPSSWYTAKPELDAAEKENYVADGLQKWLKWEQDTRRLYTTLMDDESLDKQDKDYIKALLTDVKNELSLVHRLMGKYGM